MPTADYTRFATPIRPRNCYVGADNKLDRLTYGHLTRWHAWPMDLPFVFVSDAKREEFAGTNYLGKWRYSLLANSAGDGFLLVEPWQEAWDTDDGDGETVSSGEIAALPHTTPIFRMRLLENEHTQAQEKAHLRQRDQAEQAIKNACAEFCGDDLPDPFAKLQEEEEPESVRMIRESIRASRSQAQDNDYHGH